MKLYDSLQEQARGLSEKQVKEQLRSLATDPRFAAVVGWLNWQERAWVKALGDQSLAVNENKLIHCSGSLCAIHRAQESIATIITKGSEKPQSALQPEDG